MDLVGLALCVDSLEEIVKGSSHEVFTLIGAIQAELVAASLAIEVLSPDDLHASVAELEGVDRVKQFQLVVVPAVLNKERVTWLQRGGLAFASCPIHLSQQSNLQVLQ